MARAMKTWPMWIGSVIESSGLYYSPKRPKSPFARIIDRIISINPIAPETGHLLLQNVEGSVVSFGGRAGCSVFTHRIVTQRIVTRRIFIHRIFAHRVFDQVVQGRSS